MVNQQIINAIVHFGENNAPGLDASEEQKNDEIRDKSEVENETAEFQNDEEDTYTGRASVQ